MRKTKASEAILKTLRSSGRAWTHKELQDTLGQTCDRVTTYRVLGRLLEEGLAHKVSDLEGAVRYAACQSCESSHTHSHAHLHFTCSTCSETRCLEEVEVAFSLPAGFLLAESNFSVTGVCDRCQ